MASTATMEEKMNGQFAGAGLKCVDAFILVGVVLTNGRATSRRKAARLVRTRRQVSQSGVQSSVLALRFRGEEQHVGHLRDASAHVGPGVNTALHPNKWTRRSHAIVFTLCAHGYLIHPTMASDYAALHTVRRMLTATT